MPSEPLDPEKVAEVLRRRGADLPKKARRRPPAKPEYETCSDPRCPLCQPPVPGGVAGAKTVRDLETIPIGPGSLEDI